MLVAFFPFLKSSEKDLSPIKFWHEMLLTQNKNTRILTTTPLQYYARIINTRTFGLKKNTRAQKDNVCRVSKSSGSAFEATPFVVVVGVVVQVNFFSH